MVVVGGDGWWGLSTCPHVGDDDTICIGVTFMQDPEFFQLVFHCLNSIALLNPLVCDSRYTGCVVAI